MFDHLQLRRSHPRQLYLVGRRHAPRQFIETGSARRQLHQEQAGRRGGSLRAYTADGGCVHRPRYAQHGATSVHIDDGASGFIGRRAK